jgi:hypothetical protein
MHLSGYSISHACTRLVRTKKRERYFRNAPAIAPPINARTPRYRKIPTKRNKPVKNPARNPTPPSSVITSKRTRAVTTIAANNPANRPALPALKGSPPAMNPAANPPTRGPKTGIYTSMITVRINPIPTAIQKLSFPSVIPSSPEVNKAIIILKFTIKLRL